MKNYPILPLPIALEAIEELKGFVSSLLYSRDAVTRDAILKCLFEDDPMIKGPFIDIRMPYKSSNEDWILDELLKPIAYKFGSPYIHQFKSFRQLKYSKAVNTIVTTGTGSGKSECFSFPAFDYILNCKRNKKIKGVKVLVLYPMNALIDDQGERITQIANKLNENLDESSHIRIGRYTGSDGQNTVMDSKNPKQIIDDRKTLIENPPDILLTNYRMLDFMLMRPEEQSFWSSDTTGVFKYIVIDEIHTFDGAQGADVAALLRRLKLKLALDKIVCVGTSATIASSSEKSNPLVDLCEFATTLFGEEFSTENVITNETMSLRETFDTSADSLSIKSLSLLEDDSLNTGYKDCFKEIAKKWKAPTDINKLSEWVKNEKKYFTLLDHKLDKGETLESLSEKSGLSKNEVNELLTLLSFARNKSGKSALIPQSTQIWSQGTKYLYRKLSKIPEFVRAESIYKLKEQNDIYLPSISCRACGASGWLTHLKQDSFSQTQLPVYSLAVTPSEIMRKFQNKEAQILFHVNSDAEDATYFYRPDIQRVYHKNEIKDFEDTIPVHVAHQDSSRGNAIKIHGEALEHCPECDTKLSLSLGLMGTSMLGSVLTGQFLASHYNPTDKKFLIFNDSVQDAHHQAGYLSARGYRFNTRRFIYQLLKKILDEATTISLTELQTKIKSHLEQLWENALSKDVELAHNSKLTLTQLLPKDLWERWNSEKRSQFLKDAKGKSEFLERILWESWMEMTIQSDLGWSLRKTALVLLEPTELLIKNWIKALENVEIQSPRLKINDKKSYVYGLLRKFVLQGCLFNEEFKTIYNPKKYSKWAYLSAKPHLQGVLVFNYPKLISLIEYSNESFIRPAHLKGNSWYKKWAEKHGVMLPADAEMLNAMLFSEILKLNAGLIQIDKDNKSVFALDPINFFISRDHAVLKRCKICAYLTAQDSIFSDLNTSCFQMRCNGHLHSEIDAKALAAESKYRLYMKSHYEKDMISPLAHPHTGQLKGYDRRQIEEAFKNSLLPGDKFSEGSKKIYKDQPINVLTCTPTMEMGIDIGTLSGVGLRSFPPTQASAVQRIGRSGRSSGNAYNIILLKDRPHDLTYWEDPQLYFKGSVRTPGCEFRNTQLLLRQFNAFLLDTFAKDNPELKIPKVDQDEKVDLKKTTYWSTLLKFIRTQNKTLVKDFVKIVLNDKNSNQIKPNELESFLNKKWKSNTFADQLDLVLSVLSKDENSVVENVDSEESEEPENIAPVIQSKTRSFYKKQDLNEDTYVLKILADKGLLPNYAFPDKGVILQYDLHLKTSSQNQKDQNKWISKTIERPPKSGLSDLALGQFYYSDGFKVQISRAEKPKDHEIPRYILCDECGSLTFRNDLSATLLHDCPECNAADRPVIESLDYRYVYASDRFENSMISDNDDERVKKPMVIETYFEKSPENGVHFTWTSSEARIGFDFSVDQKIFHVNRNYQFGQTAMYYKVCPYCLAVPYSVDKVSNKQIFKSEHQFNRHSQACQLRNTPNEITEIDLKSITLSRSLTSDVIRVVADNLESVPTLRAALRFAMKVYLKGEAQHLQVESSSLNNPNQSQIHLVTLYDNVPGGTGNLRSLMQLSTKSETQSYEGFKKLKSIFSDSLLKLSKCECVNGCYNCLLSFENQFEHKKIFKAKAISWFTRFNESDDWVVEENLINVKVGSDFRFGSPMEDKFIELLRAHNKISFIDRVNEITQDGEQVFQLIGPELKHQASIVPRSDIKIPIQGSIPYTKPDFVLCAKNQIASYIYVDGTEFHLNPEKEESTFEKTDIFTRPALQDKLNRESSLEIKKVLTLTSDMVNEIGSSTTSNSNNNGFHNIFETLVQLFYNDTEPDFNEEAVKKSINLFANQSIKELVLQKNIFWTKKDSDDLSGFLKRLSSKFKEQRFGGLRFDHNDKKFKMSINKKYRTSDNQLKDHYAQSWNLYWILNYIDSEIVEIED